MVFIGNFPNIYFGLKIEVYFWKNISHSVHIETNALYEQRTVTHLARTFITITT